ncbi:MAG TPA: DinB family protein [Pyrinomonadaceae bacterium]|nr:DinB family protein [Pyrinomonadaceae bacterium]
MDKEKALREHLLELLDGKSAHIDLESALKDFPSDKINDKPDGSPHSAWQLLEHIRIAQWDILDFCRNPNYKEMKWPDDYWPKDDGTKETWDRSVKLVLDDLQAMREIVSNESTDLFAKIPHGSGQTILREAMLVADHNAYHVGQIVFIKKMLES